MTHVKSGPIFREVMELINTASQKVHLAIYVQSMSFVNHSCKINLGSHCIHICITPYTQADATSCAKWFSWSSAACYAARHHQQSIKERTMHDRQTGYFRQTLWIIGKRAAARPKQLVAHFTSVLNFNFVSSQKCTTLTIYWFFFPGSQLANTHNQKTKFVCSWSWMST